MHIFYFLKTHIIQSDYFTLLLVPIKDWKHSFFPIIVVKILKLNDSVHYMSRVMRKPDFSLCEKKKVEISSAVTAQLISTFVFAKQIVQVLFYLNLKFQASSPLQWLHNSVCDGPG